MEIEEINEIMEDTCWSSLAFCCDLEKPCPERDMVMEDLGISKEDFTNLKQNFNKDLYNLISCKEVKK